MYLETIVHAKRIANPPVPLAPTVCLSHHSIPPSFGSFLPLKALIDPHADYIPVLSGSHNDIFLFRSLSKIILFYFLHCTVST